MFSVWYAPFFSHVLDAWSKRGHSNVKFLFYEDMKQVNIKYFHKMSLI